MLAVNTASIDRSAISWAGSSSKRSWMGATGSHTHQAETVSSPTTHFSANEGIYAQGEPTQAFYRVASGVVRTCRFLADGRRQIEAFYGPGAVFGFELSGARNFDAEAVTECEVRSYPRLQVISDGSGETPVPHELLYFAMERAERAQEHAMLLGRRSAAERMAAFLIEWSERTGQANRITLAMSRQDIGDYLGLTIETVSRTLTQFERDRLISIPTPREIHILNRHALDDLHA